MPCLPFGARGRCERERLRARNGKQEGGASSGVGGAVRGGLLLREQTELLVTRFQLFVRGLQAADRRFQLAEALRRHSRRFAGGML